MKKPPPPAPTRATGEALRAAILRSVASSTALETGRPIAEIERMLRDPVGKYRHLKLAR